MPVLKRSSVNALGERSCPDDEAHRVMRSLGLTVVTCEGSGCNNLRDLGAVARSRFGDEDESALAAMNRINVR